MGDFIGKGHFGEVYKGILNGGFVALKKVRNKSNVTENSSKQQLNDEVERNLSKIAFSSLFLMICRHNYGTGFIMIRLYGLLA